MGDMADYHDPDHSLRSPHDDPYLGDPVEEGKDFPFVILSDDEGEDIPVYDSKVYKVTFSSKGIVGSFRGWFSALKSTPYRLMFHGELAGDWIVLTPKSIRSIEVDER